MALREGVCNIDNIFWHPPRIAQLLLRRFLESLRGLKNVGQAAKKLGWLCLLRADPPCAVVYVMARGRQQRGDMDRTEFRMARFILCRGPEEVPVQQAKPLGF